MIIKIIFIVLAALCKAAVDTIIHHGGGKLKVWFGDFFDVNKQGKFLPLTKYPFDGLHVFNSLMILFFLLAITTDLILIVAIGIIFVIAFKFFWDNIFN